MRYAKTFRAAGIAVLLLAVAPRAHAQFGGGSYGGGYGGGTATDVVSSAGDSGVAARYNKAKKGTNVQEWAKRLGDDDPERRLEAVKSFGDSNDPKAIDYLVQAVGDSDPRVEAKAIDYLGRIHAVDATPFLIQKLFTVGTKQKLRHRILMSLGKIGDPRATKPILQYVMQDQNLDTRGAGIYAIGEIGDQSIHDELKLYAEVEENPQLKQLAGEALTKISLRKPAPAEKNPSSFPTALEAALATDKDKPE
jgi:HEAT repeat protein